MTTPRRTSEEANHQRLYIINQILAINGGSAPRDNLYSPYSPERQRSLGHRDEPQRQISSEELLT